LADSPSLIFIGQSLVEICVAVVLVVVAGLLDIKLLYPSSVVVVVHLGGSVAKLYTQNVGCQELKGRW